MNTFLLKKILAPRQMEYLIMDATFRIADASIGVLRFAETGYSAELYRNDVRLAFPELIGMESVLQSLFLQDLSDFQIKGISRRGCYFDLLIISNTQEKSNELTLIFDDVTEKMLLSQTLAQRTNETLLLMEKLSKSKEYLRRIIDMMADILIVVSPDGKIKTINQATLQLFGYEGKYESLIGQPITRLFPDADRLRDATQETELMGITKEGKNIPIAFSCARIPIEDQQYEQIFSGRNITARKEVEAQLEAARVLAIAASQSKSLFLANMSHEIRTPMNAVVGMAELLLDTPLNPEQREFIENIRIGADALVVLINDILDISKLEVGQLSLESLPFNISVVIEEVVAILASQAHRKGLEIFTWIDRQLSYSLQGDKHRIKQIVTNLVNNAIKFTPQGEITIRVELESQSERETTILCAVTDTGIGIPMEQKELLFQSFAQGDISTTRRYGGTGLGLAICKQLVILMGGEIDFESWVGKGSCFWFTITLPHNLELVYEQPNPNLEAKHVLLFDSHQISCAAFREQISSFGMRYTAVANLDQAHHVLCRSSADIILIDKGFIDRGEISGQAVRMLPGCQQIPIIVLIKSHEITTARQVLRHGIDQFLIKPVSRQRLLVLLSNLLGNTEFTKPKPVLIVNPKSLQILLAEDNLTNQLVMVKLLERLGYTIDLANNGEEVLHKLAQKDYDLIFMDCQMPVLDGYETTQRIREQEKAEKHITIIAITASAMQEDYDRCLAVGMNGYLSKPISLKKLEQILETVEVHITNAKIN